MMESFGSQSIYLEWAKIDKSYQIVDSMTGIYQCYCRFGPSYFEPLVS